MRRLRRAPNECARPSGFVVREISLRHRFVDHADRGTPARSSRVESAAAQERNAEHLEVVAGDAAVIEFRLVAVRERRPAFDEKLWLIAFPPSGISLIIAACTPGSAFMFSSTCSRKRVCGATCAITRLGQLHAHGQDVIGLEARSDTR